MRSQTTIITAWPYLFSLLLLAVIGGIMFGGLKSLYDYRRSADPTLPLNSATLHFFTREFLERRYLHLVAEPPPKQTSLPTFRVFAAEQDLEALEADLPASAKSRYVSGHMSVDNPELHSEVQFRYRGGLPLHWLYDKKSIRIKLPPYTTYRGERSFNLVNPSTIHTITDLVSYDLSRSLNLLTPEYFPARLTFNENTNGLHFYLSQIDESFLRKNRRMPGSVYSGDTIYTANPFGSDKAGISEATYKSTEGESLMWVDERLWEKDAARNAENADDRSDIQKYIQIINSPDPRAFMEDFERFFDKEKYYAFWGLDTLVGGYHHDNFHNHKIYFDPYKGKFEPIQWDLRFWSSLFPSKDLPVNPLLKQVILNPVLEYERDLFAYSLLTRFPTQEIFAQIDEADARVREELAADAMRQQPDSRYGRFELNKEVPFSMADYGYAIEELKLTYKMRHGFLYKTYRDVTASFTVIAQPGDQALVTIAVSGNSPIEFDPAALTGDDNATEAKVYRLHDHQKLLLESGKTERLFPGRSIVKGNAISRADNWAILAFGREKPMPAPLHYEFLVTGISDRQIAALTALSATNAITGDAVAVEEVDTLPDLSATRSVHPWSLSDPGRASGETMLLSGEIEVNEDRIFSKQQPVTIAPGTTFRMGKHASLIFYSRVTAVGSAEQPIRFERKTQDEPWGSLVIQGGDASGSVLEHVHVRGGSVTNQRLINYPGQLNIHDVSSFRLRNCVIEANSIGDDALHIAYSKGDISACHFENTAFDALDIDVAEVNASNLDFINIGNDAMDLMTSTISARNITIYGAGDKCFSVGESSQVTIENSKLANCHTGIAVKDESVAKVTGLHFQKIRENAISLFIKNPRYGSGGTISGSGLSGISVQDVAADAKSVNMLSQGSFAEELEKNPALVGTELNQ